MRSSNAVATCLPQPTQHQPQQLHHPQHNPWRKEIGLSFKWVLIL
jgi:hypothetical protein